MSGKDVGGDFCAGFTGELRKLVIAQGQHNKVHAQQKGAEQTNEHTPQQQGRSPSEQTHSQR